MVSVLIQSSIAFAKEHLSAIKRQSGETYYSHCMEVAAVLQECTEDPEIVQVAHLHDLLVHPNGTELLKKAPLTDDQKNLVRKMYELRKLHIDRNTEDLDYVIDSIAADPKLFVLRMAHRLNDIRHINRFSKTRKLMIARESIHMYAAIAGRLGMDAWRYEIEDTCFDIVFPKIANDLDAKIAKYKKLDDMCLKHAASLLQTELSKQGVECEIDKRHKARYSIYRKMVIKKRIFEDLTDRLALRIITTDIFDCYKALAVIHGVMNPIPGKLKDYIGAPKENGYRSIHTVVYPLAGVSEQPIEIQIRTVEMHKSCEYGSAAHAEYKKALYAINAKPARVDLFRNLANLKQEARSPKEFRTALRNYFREDRIGVFNSKNKLYHFKAPLTALDFVYHTHPKQYSKAKEIRINGRKRPFETELKDGDIVEVKFAKADQILKDWMKACAHDISKKHLRSLLKGKRL